MRRYGGLLSLSLLVAAPLTAQPLLQPSVTTALDIERELIAIRDIYFADDGQLVVLDDHQVVVFDAQGAVAHEWGSEGEGPGEFETPLSVAVEGGSALVGEQNEISALTLTGEYEDTYRVDGAVPFIVDIGYAGAMPVALVLDMMVGTHVVRLEDGRELMAVGGRLVPGVLFAAAPVMAVLPGGRIAASSGAAYEIHVMHVDGSDITTVIRDMDPRQVTEAFQDKLKRYMRAPDTAPEGWSTWVGSSSPVPDALMARLQFAETFPVISRMFSGPGHALWVQRGLGVDDDLAAPIDPPSPEFTSYDLFDLDTLEYKGVVRLPGDFQPMTGTDTLVAGVVTSGIVPRLRVLSVTF